MFCSSCGKENNEDARFCSRCGKPMANAADYGQAPMNPQVPVNSSYPGQNPMAAPPKKSALPIVLGIAAVFVVLAVGVAGFFGAKKLFFDKKDEPVIQTEREKDLPQDEQGETTADQSVQEGAVKEEPRKTDSGVADKAPSGEEAAAEEPSSEEKLIQEYLEEELLSSVGLLDVSHSYAAKFIPYDMDGYTYADIGYLDDIEGVANYAIRDFDKDGEDEILALMLKDTESWNGSIHKALWFQIYEKEGSGLRLADEKIALDAYIGGEDMQQLEFYIKETDSRIYIVERNYGMTYSFADGSDYGIHILHYENSSLESDLDRGFGGSDFSDTEEEVAQIANELRNLGFPATADGLDYDMEVNVKDGLEFFFLVQGVNFAAGEDHYSPWDLMQTGELFSLEGITYWFYRDMEEHDKRFHFSGYRTEREDNSVSDGAYTIVSYFDKIIFQGNDDEVIGWLNRKMEETAASLRKTEEELSEMLEMISTEAMDSEWYWEPHSVESVYYDGTGNISVAYSWEWFMGGVYNNGWLCMNYNLETRRSRHLQEVLGTDYDTTRRMLAEALADQLDGDTEYWYNYVTDIYNLDFYYNEDTVTVCFAPYSLGWGGSGISVTFDRP